MDSISFLGCCKKLSQTMDISSLMVLEAKVWNQGVGWQGHTPSKVLGENSAFFISSICWLYHSSLHLCLRIIFSSYFFVSCKDVVTGVRAHSGNPG